MENMLAYCGLECNTCPIHLATIEKDKYRQHIMRVSIAAQCAKQYGMNCQYEDITDCDGCRANTGRLFSGCLTCEIRKCAIRKNIESCAYCTDYICDKLKKHFLLEPAAQKRLEELL